MPVLEDIHVLIHLQQRWSQMLSSGLLEAEWAAFREYTTLVDPACSLYHDSQL